MQNVFIDALVSKIRDSKKSESNAEWICENTTLGGRPFSFKNHEFQIGIVNDTHDRIVTKKISQVGLSEISIRKTIAFLARYPGVRAMYSFPTSLLKSFNSKSRLKPLITTDFPAKGDEVRSADLYQIDNSFLYVASCSEGDATSNPVDMLVIDELDLSSESNVILLNSRLQHSQWKIREQLSTPTFSDFGIDAAFQAGDQRQYVYKCEHCNNVLLSFVLLFLYRNMI